MVEKFTGPEHISDNERVEKNIREQLDLRVRFAEAMSQKTGEPFKDALRAYTDLFPRVMGRFPRRTDKPDTLELKWTAYAAEVAALPNREAQVERLVALYKEAIADAVDHTKDPYWPFRYDPPKEDGSVHIHFGSLRAEPVEDPDKPGLLSSERYQEMRAKLKAMFREIKTKYPDPGLIVHGASWLYNREEYRRFYPTSYTAQHTIRKGNYTGGGTWGQFRQKDGSVRKEYRNQFVQNLDNLDPEKAYEVFPLKTWSVSAPIEDFYKEYGIE